MAKFRKPKFKPKAVKVKPAEFVYNTKWTDIFISEDEDQALPIYGAIPHVNIDARTDR